MKYFFSLDNIWRSCVKCNYKDDGIDILPVKSKVSSLMVPRLPFTEWTGFDSGDSAQQMTGASRGLTLLTLADIESAAWLVENNHLTQLERIIFTTDLDTQSVNTEVENIKRVAGTVLNKSDDQIFEPVQGNLITTSTEMFNIDILLHSADLVN